MNNISNKSSSLILLAISLFVFLFLGISSPPQKIENKNILIIRPSSSIFDKANKYIEADLKKTHLSNYIIDNNTPYENFATKLKEIKPDFMVLMDNTAINFGKRWNQESQQKTPGLGMLGLHLSEVLRGDQNISGIAFETPVFSIFSNFSYYFDYKIKSILVFYRKSVFYEDIQSSKKQLQRININLDAINVEEEGTDLNSVKNFLKDKLPSYLTNPNKKYDAVWIMLDSILLSKDQFYIWKKVAQKSPIPFLSGIESLAQPEINVATFVVIPNLKDLTHQAVQIIYRILNDSESPSSIGVESTISVSSILNRQRVRELGLKLNEVKLLDLEILER